jgi:hypothetical protein
MIAVFFSAYYDFEDNLINDLESMIYYNLRTNIAFDLLSCMPINTLYNVNVNSLMNDYLNQNNLSQESFIETYNFKRNIWEEYNKTDHLIELIPFDPTMQMKIFVIFRIFKIFKNVKNNHL